MTRIDVHHGDSFELIRALPAASIDAVVTDPPYALVSIGKRFGAEGAAAPQGGVYARAAAGFMGKTWDNGSTAFDPAFWAEVWRVLKPGGHVLAFAATRTYHRLACAVEDGGFEIRDMLAWLYGSGFPKSHDVAKGIDALDAVAERRARALWFTEFMRRTGLSAAMIDQLTGSQMGSHYLSAGAQPEVATAQMFDRLRPFVGFVPPLIEELVAERTVESENIRSRKVLGLHDGPSHAREWAAAYQGGKGGEAGLITAAHTDEARAWEGWGTALKPALEPVVLARKPLTGSVARNVLAHGCGALNVDGCRIDALDKEVGEYTIQRRKSGSEMAVSGGEGYRAEDAPSFTGIMKPGRWPANVVHDGSAEVVGAFPERDGGSFPAAGGTAGIGKSGHKGQTDLVARDMGDSGSAARFFYSAKADAEDRLGSAHPTVKPVDLMAWLVRLVCRPGGVVLDPFAGTGTTGLACLGEGMDAILIEREAESCADIRRRLAWARGDGRLTSQEIAGRRLEPAKAAGEGLPLFGLGN